MKKNRILLTALAAALILALSVGSALAYFTDWTQAEGKQPIHAGDTSRIREGQIEKWIKPITITNTSADVSIYVRAKVFSTYDVQCYGDNWDTVGMGEYTNYSKVLGPGKDADDILYVKVEKPENAKDGEGFNVIVVYEAVPVLYNEDGTPKAPDWTQKIIEFKEQG